jgi:hypothetical protein
MEDFEPMTYDDWKTTDPAAEFLGDAEQRDSEEEEPDTQYADDLAR